MYYIAYKHRGEARIKDIDFSHAYSTKEEAWNHYNDMCYDDCDFKVWDESTGKFVRRWD